MNEIRPSPTPVKPRVPIVSTQESAIILRDHKYLLKFNQMAVEIHAAGSRDELVGLVTESLPITLDSEETSWSEHGPVVPMDLIGFHTSGQDAIIALILARLKSGHSLLSSASFQQAENGGADLGVYDVAALISSSRRLSGSDFPFIDHEMRTRHQVVTHFFIDDHRGILLTVQNSRPFTAEQKFTLSLLREHLAVAARRLCRSDPDPASLKPIPGGPVLSRRENEVLPHLVKGYTNPEIAKSLGISPRTVEKHVASILDKSGLDNRRMLIGLASFPTHENTRVKNG